MWCSLPAVAQAGGAAGAAVRFDGDSGCFELVAQRRHAAGEIELRSSRDPADLASRGARSPPQPSLRDPAQLLPGRLSDPASTLPGEPLLIDYGLRASHKLLRLYGFLAPRDEEPTVTGGEAGGGGSGVGGEGGGGGGGGGGGVGGVSGAPPPLGQPGTATWEWLRIRPIGAPPPEADEVVVPLLPSVAEMGGDADESARQIEEARAALAACGLRGSSVRLGVSPDGSVLLPALASTAPSAAAAAARHVFRTALEAQRERQREGSAACLAVEGMAEMDEAGNAAARDRARLCLRLHEREGAAVEEAIAELERTAS